MKKSVLLCALAVFTLGLALPIQAQVNKDLNAALFTAVEQGNFKEVKNLIAQGADVNATDKKVLTPLHYAVLSGNLKMSKLLIKDGADVNAHSNESETPLYLAVIHNNEKMVKLLTSSGADANISLTSWTPLFHSCLHGYKTIVKLLLKNGADMSQGIVSPVQATLVCHEEDCTLKDKEEILKILIKYGVDIDSVNPDSETSLDRAVIENNTEVVKMLFKLGSKLEKGKHAKWYPLIAVRDYNNKEMLEILIDNGADLNVKNDQGKTPLDYAKTEEMQQLLIKYGAKSGKDLK